MKKQSLIAFLIVLLTACAAPLGTITVHKVGDGDKLTSPLVQSKQLTNDKNTVFKTDKSGVSSGEDVFAIYLTDTYLRYLKDWGGINEVLIVVEFTEAVTGTTQDTITKILGPYNNIADATRAPLLNKALYGPKKMESDLLTMNLKVYEYDLEENENNAAMLEFIAGSASALALADPVTLGEIKIAKEIAQTLIRTNENDLVIDFDLDFVAGSKKYKTYSNSRVLPLKDSELVVVKQEACRIGTCWDYFSNFKNGSATNGPGVVTDIVMALPTAVVKATTDVPDSDSLSPFIPDEVSVSDSGLVKSINQNKNERAKFVPFLDKTWLRLSVVKGGDPSLWTARRALYPTEEEINKLLRNPNALTVENMKAMTARIEKIQKEVEKGNAQIVLTSKFSRNGTHFILNGAGSSSLCMSHTKNVELNDNQAILFMDTLAGYNISKVTSSKDTSCFELTHASFTPDKGLFQVNYQLAEQTSAVHFPVIVADKLTGTASATCAKDSNGEGNTVTITLTADTVKQVADVTLDKKSLAYSVEGGKLIIPLSNNAPTLAVTDVFGAVIKTPALTCT